MSTSIELTAPAMPRRSRQRTCRATPCDLPRKKISTETESSGSKRTSTVSPASCGGASLRRQQGSEQPGGAVLQLGIGHEQGAMQPAQLSGKAGDFLAYGG